MLLMLSAILSANSVHKWSTGKKMLIFGAAIFWDIIGLIIILCVGFTVFMNFVFEWI